MEAVMASVPREPGAVETRGGHGWVAALALHRGSFVPLHRQIHDLVRQEIVTDRLPPG